MKTVCDSKVLGVSTVLTSIASRQCSVYSIAYHLSCGCGCGGGRLLLDSTVMKTCSLLFSRRTCTAETSIICCTIALCNKGHTQRSHTSMSIESPMLHLSKSLYRSEAFLTLLPFMAVMMSPKTSLPYLSREVPLIPDFQAGPPFLASSTRMPCTPNCMNNSAFLAAPCSHSMHTCSEASRRGWLGGTCSLDWSGANEMPRMGRMTLPKLMICSTLLLTISTGIAKPTPLFAPLGLYMAVLMPAHDSPPSRWHKLSSVLTTLHCTPALPHCRAACSPMRLPSLSSSGPPELPGFMAASVCITSCSYTTCQAQQACRSSQKLLRKQGKH